MNGPGGFLPPDPGGQPPELGWGAPPARPAPPAQESQPQQPQPWQPPPPGWGSPAATEPDNGPAVAGFAFSISSIGLLVLSASLSTVVSLGLGIAGIVMSRKGKRLVQEGHTNKHKDLASAGFAVGTVSTVLSALATLFWIAIVVIIATDDGARQDFQDSFDESSGRSGMLRLVVPAARVVGIAL